MKKIVLVIMASLSMVLVGCKGGGGNTSTGGTYLTHSELAADFVYRLNVDAGYDVELVKTYTDQYDYIVVYDYDLDSYDAYYLGAYNPGENVVRYLDTYDWDFYYDLIPLSGNFYEDPITGIIFEKTGTKVTNTKALKAIAQNRTAKKASKMLQAEFGMDASKANKIGSMLQSYNSIAPERRTDKMVDDMFSEITGGTTYSDFLKASKPAQAKILLDGAIHSGINPAVANDIILKEVGL